MSVLFLERLVVCFLFFVCFYFFSNLAQNCEVENEDCNCSKCNSGYGLNTLFGTCINCSLISGSIFIDGLTPCQCPTGKYLDYSECVDCLLDNDCLSCDPINGQCTNCPAGKIISGTGCIECGNGTWSNGGNETTCSS